MYSDDVGRLIEDLVRSLTDGRRSKARDSNVLEVSSEDEFNNLLSSNKYVVICFYKPDCPACKSYVPIFELVSKKFRGIEAKFIKVHTGNLKSLSRRYKVVAIPTTLVLVNGSEVARYEGSMTEIKLMTFLIAAGLHP